jgi:Glycosyl transferase family 2.
MKDLYISGIMPTYNVLSGQYPFVECIILALPLVDEMIIMDLGSDDGTKDVLEKIASLNNKIKLKYINVDFEKYKSYEAIDINFIDTMYNDAKGNWIIAFHADEFFHPSEYDVIRKTIYKAHIENYNSIRHSLYHIDRLSYLCDDVNWNRVRIFRKIKGLVSKDAIDGFYVNNCFEVPQGYVQSNIQPELYSNDITSHHLGNIFLKGRILANMRHKDVFKTQDIVRIEHNEQLKEFYNIKDVDDLKNFHFFYTYESFHPRLPDIFKGLMEMKEYYVRDELYNLLKQ